MYICIYVYMYVCIYVYMYICIYAYMHICIYVYMYTCICVYLYVGVCVCVCVCMYVCIYIYIYIYIHTTTTAASVSDFACTIFRCQSYTSKGIWRQDIGSLERSSYVSALCPVVICPYLCTSEDEIRTLVYSLKQALLFDGRHRHIPHYRHACTIRYCAYDGSASREYMSIQYHCSCRHHVIQIRWVHSVSSPLRLDVLYTCSGLILLILPVIPVSVKTTILRRRIHMKLLASKTPNQGLNNSFCCWTAGQRLAQKECSFHRHRYPSRPDMYIYIYIYI